MSVIKRKLNIPDDVWSNIQQIVSTFNKNGYKCYLVGGSVRDLLMGRDVYDYDFATDAKPQVVTKMFKRVIPTGLKHGTVSVLLSGKSYEVTTFRADGKYIDGRRPESVSFSKDLKEDVIRRDFTINGIAYEPLKGEIIDYVNGIADIEAGIIRTIGNSIERLSEDGLRSYRACRFASKLNFKIEEETFDAIKKTLDVSKNISVERIREEFMKLLQSETPSVGLEYLRECGLLEQFLPELDSCYGVSQNKYHVHDIYYHSVYSCDGAKKDMPMIRLSALLHDLGKLPTRKPGKDGDNTFYNHEVVGAKIARRLMKRLKFSNEEISKVNNLVLNHMFHYTDEWTDGAVRRFMRKVGVENLEDLILLRMADRFGTGSREGMPGPIKVLKKRIEKAIEEENAITVKDLEIDGHIIMKEFSVTPGPIIGKILNELLEIILDEPEKNNSKFLLEKSKEVYETLNSQERL